MKAHPVALLPLSSCTGCNQSASLKACSSLNRAHWLLDSKRACLNTGFISTSLCGTHAHAGRDADTLLFFVCEKGTRLQDCAPKPSPKFTLCFLIKSHVSFLLHSESSKEIWFLLFGTDLLSGSLDHQSGRWGLLIHRLNHFRSLSSASDCPPPRGKLRRGGWCEGPDYFLAHSRATSKPASLKCICASLFPSSNDSPYPAANESSGQASHEQTDVVI